MAVWSWPNIIYLFLGGLSGGLFIVIASLESYDFVDQYKQSIRRGAIVSWILTIVGVLFLIMHLGRSERSITTLIYPHFTSPMSWGVTVIILFLIVNLIYVITDTGFLLKTKSPATLEFLQKYRVGIAMVGGLFGILTGIYTGILLLYTRYEIWCCPVLPLLFLSSALGTGYALFLLIAKSKNELNEPPLEKQRNIISIILGGLTLIATILYLIRLPSEATSSLLDIGTTYGLIFVFVFIIGGLIIGEIILPWLDMQQTREMVFYISIFLILLGGFALRYVIVFLGPTV